MDIDDIVKKTNDPSSKEYQIMNRHEKEYGGGYRYTLGPTLDDRKLKPFTSVLMEIVDGGDIAFVRKPVIDITAPSTPLTLGTPLTPIK